MRHYIVYSYKDLGNKCKIFKEVITACTLERKEFVIDLTDE